MKLFFATVLLSASLCQSTSHAQQPARDWPRHPDSGRIEVVGTLPWPVVATTPPQRRTLTRRWFVTRLKERNQPAMGEDTTYAGLPNYSYLDSVWVSPVLNPDQEKVIYRLSYQVELVPGQAGLTYRFHDFMWYAIGEDFGTQLSLENALPKFAVQMRVYERRLRQALSEW